MTTLNSSIQITEQVAVEFKDANGKKVEIQSYAVRKSAKTISDAIFIFLVSFANLYLLLHYFLIK